MSPTDQRFSSSEFYDSNIEPQTSKNEREEKKSVSAKAAVVEASETHEPDTDQSSIKAWHVLTVLGLVAFYHYVTKDEKETSNNQLDMEESISDTDSVVFDNETVSLPSPIEPVVASEPKRVTFLDKD